MTKTELKQKWKNLIDLLLEQPDDIDSTVVKFLCTPLQPVKIVERDKKLILTVVEDSKSISVFKTLLNNHLTPIKSAIVEVFGKEYTPEIIEIDPDDGDEEDEWQKSDYIDPKQTFDTFVMGPTNRIACAASLAVADGYTKTYNPLFIYAGSGLGKTHLMNSIVHFVKINKPRKKVLYVNADTFITELTEAIRTHKQNQFKDKYRNVDYLLFDDVQFIAGNKFVEEELFNTFETLYSKNKQMVFTSDRPHKELGDIPERLVSRFVWGFMVDIQPPDYETKMAILKNKAVLEKVDIKNKDIIEVFDFIARNAKSNIRELESFFTRVLAFSKLSNEDITLPFAKSVLQDIIEEDSNKISPEDIKKAVAKYYSIKVSDLESSKRSREISYPRHIAVYLIRKNLNLSYPSIAKIFGGKDHTSIMHSFSVIEKELKSNKDMQNTLDSIMNTI